MTVVPMSPRDEIEGERSAGAESPRRERLVAKDALLDRSLGALWGAIGGDAVGAQTRFLARAGRDRPYPQTSSSPMLRGEGTPLATVTTPNAELGAIFGELLLEGEGHIDGPSLRAALIRWVDVNRESPRAVDPGISRALEDLERGVDPRVAGRYGDTNGCLPGAVIVGVATPPRPLSALVDRVEEVCRLTHNTCIAIAGAAAVATAVSTGVEGAALVHALGAGEEAAEIGAQRGYYVPGANVAERIDWALELVAAGETARSLALISELVGTGIQIQETVPAAFAVALLWPDDPWRVCLEAARLGGDTSSVGAGAAAIAGSAAGLHAFPVDAREVVSSGDRLRLQDMAQGLLRLRRRGAAS